MLLPSLLSSQNSPLYQSLSARYRITLEKNMDWRETVWQTEVNDDTAVITYDVCERPEVAFAHELLHIDTEMRGYKRIRTGVSLRKDVQAYIPTLVNILDPLFQHVKMAPRFLAMGYPAELFYGEDTVFPVRFWMDELQKEGNSSLYMTSLYLSFLKPLMGLGEQELQTLKKKFGEYEDGRYQQQAAAMETALQDWAHDESYDAEPYLKKILLAAGVTDTWFSYEKDTVDLYENKFPGCGFFVGNPFTVKEVGEVYGH